MSYLQKVFWCPTWAFFVVSCEHTHGVSTHTYTVHGRLQRFMVFGTRLSGTVLTARFLSVTLGGACAHTGAIPISRARRIRGLLRDMKRGRALGMNDLLLDGTLPILNH